jgi:hypothetical protein
VTRRKSIAADDSILSNKKPLSPTASEKKKIIDERMKKDDPFNNLHIKYEKPMKQKHASLQNSMGRVPTKYQELMLLKQHLEDMCETFAFKKGLNMTQDSRLQKQIEAMADKHNDRLHQYAVEQQKRIRSRKPVKLSEVRENQIRIKREQVLREITRSTKG